MMSRPISPTFATRQLYGSLRRRAHLLENVSVIIRDTDRPSQLLLRSSLCLLSYLYEYSQRHSKGAFHKLVAAIFTAAKYYLLPLFMCCSLTAFQLEQSSKCPKPLLTVLAPSPFSISLAFRSSCYALRLSISCYCLFYRNRIHYL